MTPTLAAQWTVRIAGLITLVLGLVIWAASPGMVYPLHMLLGVILTAGLWALAILGIRAGTGPVLPAIAVAWSVLMVLFGLNQVQILPENQSIVEVAHLLVGLVAIGIGEALGARIRRVAATA
jgi:hypothetical protein